MPDNHQVKAAERALQSSGLFYSQDGDGWSVYQALKTKYPKANLHFVNLTTSSGYLLSATNRLPTID
ncbi:hypothetical protein BH10PSE7_BH10PSE7_11260 [soil metagenome]